MKYFDNTRISSFRNCRRKFYFRHRRDWTSRSTAIPLVMGLSIHDAMDAIWQGADSSHSDNQLLHVAGQAFIERWRSEGLPGQLEVDEEKKMLPRTPMNALEILHHYIKERRVFLAEETRLIACELPFYVPMFENRDLWYVGRLDKVFQMKRDERIYIGEHKTTSDYSVKQIFQPRWVDSFSPNSQIDGYSYAGKMIYGDAFKSVWVDGILVHKKVRGVKFISNDRHLDLLNPWLVEVRGYINEMIQASILENAGYVAEAYPRNTDRCSDWGRSCPYRDVCAFYANPEEAPIPDNMKEEKWEPFNILELAKIGMRDETSTPDEEEEGPDV